MYNSSEITAEDRKSIEASDDCFGFVLNMYSCTYTRLYLDFTWPSTNFCVNVLKTLYIQDSIYAVMHNVIMFDVLIYIDRLENSGRIFT